MKDVKFRAWDKLNESMRDVLGISLYHESISVDRGDGTYFANHASNFELMQSTRLKDKNGVEIYEGDIVQTGWLGIKKGAVVFENSTYCVDTGNGYMYFNHPESYEVIGNIYENSELLERGSDD